MSQTELTLRLFLSNTTSVILGSIVHARLEEGWTAEIVILAVIANAFVLGLVAAFVWGRK